MKNYHIFRWALILILCFSSIAISYAVASTEHSVIGIVADSDKIAFLLGLLGLLLLFVPYLSLVGLILCIAAIILAIVSRKKYERKLWRRLAVILGSLGVSVFIVVLSLVFF